ncbi:hypothetical protein FA13DRAFT_1292522 [Coprinellus micaceus]|uniref:Uncharacterized protein n=1 Tax=Coprinellus micaceus TaxID=71717 RepID=A0A4Y7SS19_COPMI|nr:hypothetical protein FA13DRAFT_1292522 [Coprinellus micaceus]
MSQATTIRPQRIHSHRWTVKPPLRMQLRRAAFSTKDILAGPYPRPLESTRAGYLEPRASDQTMTSRLSPIDDLRSHHLPSMAYTMCGPPLISPLLLVLVSPANRPANLITCSNH